MKSYFKVVDGKGRVLIPADMRGDTGIQAGDIVEMGTYENMILVDKVQLQHRDLTAKIKMQLDTEDQEKAIQKQKLIEVLKTHMSQGNSVEDMIENVAELLALNGKQ